VPWSFEPHIAEDIFTLMLTEAKVEVLFNTSIEAVELTPPLAQQAEALALRLCRLQADN